MRCCAPGGRGGDIAAEQGRYGGAIAPTYLGASMVSKNVVRALMGLATVTKDPMPVTKATLFVRS